VGGSPCAVRETLGGQQEARRLGGAGGDGRGRAHGDGVGLRLRRAERRRRRVRVRERDPLDFPFGARDAHGSSRGCVTGAGGGAQAGAGVHGGGRGDGQEGGRAGVPVRAHAHGGAGRRGGGLARVRGPAAHTLRRCHRARGQLRDATLVGWERRDPYAPFQPELLLFQMVSWIVYGVTL